jgi:hypothetical protein
LLERNYSNFVAVAMKVLTFADLFSFFLWKTWWVKNEERQKGLMRRDEFAGEQGIGRFVARANRRDGLAFSGRRAAAPS